MIDLLFFCQKSLSQSVILRPPASESSGVPVKTRFVCSTPCPLNENLGVNFRNYILQIFQVMPVYTAYSIWSFSGQDNLSCTWCFITFSFYAKLTQSCMFSYSPSPWLFVWTRWGLYFHSRLSLVSHKSKAFGIPFSLQ